MNTPRQKMGRPIGGKRMAPMADAKRVVSLLNRHRSENQCFEPQGVSLIYTGRYGNANVYCYSDKERDLVVKDFSQCVPWFKYTMGAFFVAKECRCIRALSGTGGVVSNVQKLGKHAFCYDFVKGASISSIVNENRKLPGEFFRKWERLVKEMHAQGIVHLDMRNTGNVLMDEGGRPVIIDFQSALRTRFMPGFLRKILERVDYSAVIKGWLKSCDDKLPPEQAAWYAEFLKSRNIWKKLTHPGRLISVGFWSVVDLFRRKKTQRRLIFGLLLLGIGTGITVALQ